jgi:hypothetical protein
MEAELSAEDAAVLGAELFSFRRSPAPGAERPGAHESEVSSVCPCEGGRGALLVTAFDALDEAVTTNGARLIVQCAADFSGQARECYPCVQELGVAVLELDLEDAPWQTLDAAFEAALPAIAAARGRGEAVSW